MDFSLDQDCIQETPRPRAGGIGTLQQPGSQSSWKDAVPRRTQSTSRLFPEDLTLQPLVASRGQDNRQFDQSYISQGHHVSPIQGGSAHPEPSDDRHSNPDRPAPKVVPSREHEARNHSLKQHSSVLPSITAVGLGPSPGPQQTEKYPLHALESAGNPQHLGEAPIYRQRSQADTGGVPQRPPSRSTGQGGRGLRREQHPPICHPNW